MCVVFNYVICCLFRFPLVCEVVSNISFIARPVGQGHFVFGCNFVFCMGMELCFEAKTWVVFKILVWFECLCFIDFLVCYGYGYG